METFKIKYYFMSVFKGATKLSYFPEGLQTMLDG